MENLLLYCIVFNYTFVLKLIIFNFIGGDSEVFADFNTEIDTDPSFNFLSVQSIIAFLWALAGWVTVL